MKISSLVAMFLYFFVLYLEIKCSSFVMFSSEGCLSTDYSGVMYCFLVHEWRELLLHFCLFFRIVFGDKVCFLLMVINYCMF